MNKSIFDTYLQAYAAFKTDESPTTRTTFEVAEGILSRMLDSNAVVEDGKVYYSPDGRTIETRPLVSFTESVETSHETHA